MASRFLVLALFGACTTMAGTHISFPVPNDVLQVYVSASIEQVSAVERYLRIEIVKDKASCCHGTVEFVVLVEHGGTISEIPIKISDEEVSAQNRVSAGSIAIKDVRLKLTHLELTREVPAKLYDGIVAKDDGCMSEALAALSRQGSAGRQALSDLIDNGCVELTPYVMSAGDGSLSKVHLVRGKRVGYGYLFPASWTESPRTILNGLILTSLLEDGHAQETYVLQESPVSEPIPVDR